MTERLPKPTTHVIEGEHIDIVIGHIPALIPSSDQLRHQYLSNTNRDQLPYPICDVFLEAAGKPESTMPDFLAYTTFEATALENNPEAWPKGFIEDVRLQLEFQKYTVFTLPHDPLALYAPIDALYALRVVLSPTHNRCGVDISLESIDEIKNATGFDLNVGLTTVATPDEALIHAANALAVVLNGQRSTFGNPPKHRDHTTLYCGENERRALVSRRRVIGKTAAGNILAPLDPPDIEQCVANSQGLDSVGGLTNAKAKLQSIIEAIQDPIGSSFYGITHSHIILHGPPGTGKTSLARAFAHDIAAEIIEVQSTDIVDMWVGKSGKNVDKVFKNVIEKAETAKMVVLFFDEIEAIAANSRTGTSERADVRKRLLYNVDQLPSNVIVIGATNADIDDLDSALVRPGRLEPIGAPAPNLQERIDIWSTVLYSSIQEFQQKQGLNPNDAEGHTTTVFDPYHSDINVHELAAKTDRLTGAHFKDILARARRAKFQQYRNSIDKKLVPVNQADILQAIEHLGR